VSDQLRNGVDMVVNLAAGLDARPYRMELPASLQWVEVDFPAILDYKEKILAADMPGCALERVRADLSDSNIRRQLFARLGKSSTKALVISEGLLVYLEPANVASLAGDLASTPSFRSWALDLASPGLLRRLQKQMGNRLSEGGAELKFGPPEGPGY